jgi:hypothetical protein
MIIFTLSYIVLAILMLIYLSVGKKEMPKPPEKGNDG